ncbi:MAG: peptidylprolyl isomerase [Clostridia bacterium]|nr:peptidylprolyl isomerase [Clostridia bacterium]
MMKKLMALLMALMLMLSSAFAAVAEEVTEDAVLATAFNGEVSVTMSEVKAEFDEMVQAYIAYYSQYGYEMDEYDTEFQNSVAQETVQMKLSQKVAERHAADTGYEFNEEKDEAYKAEALAALAEMMEYYTQYLGSYGVPEDQIEEVAKEELEAAGYTYETLYESAKLKGVLDHLYALGTEGVAVTDEEVKAAFDAKVAAQKETYDADVDAFISAYIGEEDILYTPEGVRLMHCIFVALEAEEAGETAETAETSETAEAAEAAETAEAAPVTGLAKAEEALAKIRAGEDFTIIMEAYNEDASTPEQMQVGYPVAETSGSYGDEFKNGAMALEKIGDVTDVIVTDYGYFILKYAADLTAGAVDFEPRKEAETAEALTNKQTDAYSTYINQMIDDAGCVINDLSPLFNVFVAESVEATVAYASVAADTDLLDMPAGAAVVKLSAGASLDVLGKITVDGSEYAFVAVPGTAFKGYVAASVMTEMAEADALAVDNTALAAAQTIEAKKPTFTIAMNDGSVIYGELYPETAPQSVGNFIALANEGFYDGLIFHRVIPGFMIQGGDPNGDGTGGPGYAIKGEFSSNGVENDLSHVRGVLSMARSSAMDSAGSQFFIMHADSDYLDGDYAAFGFVLGGLDTVDLIASQPTNSSDKPKSDQTMRTVYVETYGQTYEFTKLED